jgi:hypothetical protein
MIDSLEKEIKDLNGQRQEKNNEVFFFYINAVYNFVAG